jgi:hypothetical protein
MVSPARKQKGRGVTPWPFREARIDSRSLRKRGSAKRKDEVLVEWSASIKGEVKKKHISFGRNFSCFSAHLIERDLF